MPSEAESFPFVEQKQESRQKNKERDHHHHQQQHQQRHQQQRKVTRLVRVEEEDENSESESQKNTIIDSTKVDYYHNKAFFLHNNHNNNNNRNPGRISSKNHYLNKKNNNTSEERTFPLKNPFPVKNKDSLGAPACSNCTKNRRESSGSTRASDTNDNSQTRNNYIGKGSKLFWFLHPLSMAAAHPESSSDFHRKRAGDNGGDDDDDDQPRDSLEDAHLRAKYAGAGCGGREMEDLGDEDDDDEEGLDGLNREDLIRFLIANSGGRQGYQQNYHYQQLQQQLLHQQLQYNNPGGHYGVSASSSLHGAVGGMGLEPIMDASFQDDFDDIHSDYQWFTESG